jgi:hypothetical protein
MENQETQSLANVSHKLFAILLPMPANGFIKFGFHIPTANVVVAMTWLEFVKIHFTFLVKISVVANVKMELHKKLVLNP